MKSMHHRSSRNRIAILFSAMALIAGCGGGQAKKEKTIATSFYPMYLATANIAAGVPGVKVVNITRPFTGCLHDYQLTTEEVKTLSGADVFVVNGGGMDSFLDKVVSQLPALRVIDASEGLTLLAGENGETNPHVWVSVTGAMGQVRNIAKGLAEADSANAAAYRRNSDAYLARLDSLRERMLEGTKDLKSRDIITFHEAFPYFARELGLNVVAVIQREPGTAPSPQELAGTVKLIKSKKIRALFAEPQYPAKEAEAIARETGARVYILDPVSTGPMDDLDFYIKSMDADLITLKRALGEQQRLGGQ
jgi:zinc transport system substrate-binding protein